MILDLKSIRGYSFEQPQEDPWDTKFVSSLISHNQSYIDLHARSTQTSPNPSRIKNILDFINQPSLPEETLEIKLPVYPHSYYSSFIPIRTQNYKWVNELQKQYSYLSFLEQQYLEESQQLIENYLEQKQSVMLRCKKPINQVLNPQLPMINRVCQRGRVLKYGSGVLKGWDINMGAWNYCIGLADSYLTGMRSQTKLRHNLQITVQAFEKVTQDVISRTMKNLYCPVCLIYDCMIHDVLGNQQYVSLHNKISQQNHLSKAIGLMSNSLSSNSQQEQQCSSFCYKSNKLNKIGFFSLSPFAKSIIELGIHLFSFQPCLIVNLFKPNQIRCSQIYEFLVKQCSLFGRIQCKFYPNEYSMLINQQREYASANQILVSDNRKKKKKKNSKKVQERVGGKSICIHHFIDEPSQDIQCRQCYCRKRGFCLPQCLCTSNCSLMKIGCKCKAGNCRTNQCPCFKSKTECNPSLCRTCCSQEKMSCKNLNIQRKLRKNIRIGVSKIKEAGLGAYAGQFINKDELVTIYLGESVEPCIEQLRHSTTRDSSFYNFDTNGLTLDARFIGNKARFINHGQKGMQNLGVQILQSQGQEWICFFALRDIKEHQELYFDYDGTGQLAKHHHDKYPFIASKK